MAAEACCIWYGLNAEWFCVDAEPVHCIEYEGGIPGGPNSACDGMGPDFASCGSIPVSCCRTHPDFPTCITQQAYICINAGDGTLRAPAGCPEGICEPPPDTGACCDAVGRCHNDLTIAECEGDELQGIWQGPGSRCVDVECVEEENCREFLEPYYNEGDKEFSLDMCDTAAAGLAKLRYGDASADRLGWSRYVTLHETRNTRIPEPDDPCRLHWVDLVKNERGYLQPMMCSNTWNNEGRYSEGYFTKRVGDDFSDVVGDGRWFVVTGMENERLWPIKWMHTPYYCGWLE